MTTWYILTYLPIIPRGCPRLGVSYPEMWEERIGVRHRDWLDRIAIIAGIVILLAANQREQINSIISRKSDSWIGGFDGFDGFDAHPTSQTLIEPAIFLSAAPRQPFFRVCIRICGA
jgi:hypothetical protein